MSANNPEEYTQEMLVAVIDSLRNSTVRLQAVAAVMERNGVERLEIRNSIEMKSRGLPKIAAFAQAAEDAIREQQLGG